MNIVMAKLCVYVPQVIEPIIIPILPMTVKPKFMTEEAAPTSDFVADRSKSETSGRK